MKNIVLITVSSTFFLYYQSETKAKIFETEHNSPQHSQRCGLSLSEPFYHPFSSDKFLAVGKRVRLNLEKKKSPHLPELWDQPHKKNQAIEKLTIASTIESEDEKFDDADLSSNGKNSNGSVLLLNDEQKKLQILHVCNILSCLKQYTYTAYWRVFNKNNTKDPIFDTKTFDPLLNIAWGEFFRDVKKKRSHYSSYQGIPNFFPTKANEETKQLLTYPSHIKEENTESLLLELPVKTHMNISDETRSEEKSSIFREKSTEAKPSLFKKGQNFFTTLSQRFLSSLWF